VIVVVVVVVVVVVIVVFGVVMLTFMVKICVQILNGVLVAHVNTNSIDVDFWITTVIGVVIDIEIDVVLIGIAIDTVIGLVIVFATVIDIDESVDDREQGNHQSDICICISISICISIATIPDIDAIFRMGICN
jgi:hypothetical protein